MTGTYQELTAAAERGVSATHALIPVLRAGGALLSTHERDQLWERWQVPVYAIVLDGGGRVVAYECEAQEGLHIREWNPGSGKVESTLCECGRPGDRWIPESDQASSAV